MFFIHKCLLGQYTGNEKQSTPEELASFNSPGQKATFALNIKSIIIEEKTVLLKQLKIGSEITFKIDQEIQFSFSNQDFIKMVNGEGTGEISEMLDFDKSLEDSEYQEITIKLANGFAENL